MAGKVVQLEFFAKEKEIEQKEFNKYASKSIRGLFARYNEMEFEFLKLHERFDLLTEAVLKNG